MKHAFSLFLLLGALISLFGQVAAYATAPPDASISMAQPMAMSGMNEDCMKMMAQQKQQPGQKPCEGMTLDCIAAMGCVVPMTLRDAPTLASREIAPVTDFWPTTAVLSGSDLTPEPPPPTFLG